jgi:hypothetical protein
MKTERYGRRAGSRSCAEAVPMLSPPAWLHTKAIIATNSPIDPKLAITPSRPRTRTYVIGAEVPKKRIADALYWDTLDPYHYVRLQPGRRSDILIATAELPDRQSWLSVAWAEGCQAGNVR